MAVEAVKINEEQTLITNSDDSITKFVENGGCSTCFYKNSHSCNIDLIPCYWEDREDRRDGYFTLL